MSQLPTLRPVLHAQQVPPGALRITAKVVAITVPSPRREQLVGVLQVRGARQGTFPII